MNRKEKAEMVQKELNALYPSPNIPLSHSSSYTLLIAVLLSAQCTDERVNKITPKLFRLAKTPETMSNVKVSTIQEIIKPCGLSNTKAKAISNLSKILVSEYSGKVPKSLNELKKLPGVGQKTASVVLTQAFNIPAFPVDTHIHRLAKRWGLSAGKTVKQTEEDLKKLFPKSSWAKVHLQMIYYGREYCTARGHKIANCLICKKLKPMPCD